MSRVRDIMNELFPIVASKRVTRTDKSKSAYVLSKGQVEVLQRAGLVLAAHSIAPVVDVIIVGVPPRTVRASYYNSIRAPSPDRPPEPRMGREFISDWLEEGDQVLLATDGRQLFAAKEDAAPLSDSATQALESSILRQVSTRQLVNLVPPLPAVPPKRRSTRDEFIRSPVVAELVRRRSRGLCEFPGCRSELFVRDDGSNYLEVHHIIWLREGGADSIENAAALCPSCHRAMHSARDRRQRFESLAAKIRALPPPNN